MKRILQWNHGLWLGPLLALVGLLSYFLYFSQWPLFRDVPWANFFILSVALGLSYLGVRRAWREGGWRRGAGLLGMGLSVTFSAALLAYCFVLSYQLPPAELAVKTGGKIPTVTLSSNTGASIDLAEVATKPLILVFYRGFW